MYRAMAGAVKALVWCSLMPFHLDFSAYFVESVQPILRRYVMDCNGWYSTAADRIWFMSLGIDTCIEYQSHVSEEAFEIAGSSAAPNSRAPQLARINYQQQVKYSAQLTLQRCS